MLKTRYEMTVYADPTTNTVNGHSVKALIQDAQAVGIPDVSLAFVPPAHEGVAFDEGQTWGLRVSFESEAAYRAEGMQGA